MLSEKQENYFMKSNIYPQQTLRKLGNKQEAFNIKKYLLLLCVRSVMSASAIPQTIACQSLLSVGYSTQEYWSGLPFPSARVLPDPRIEHASLVSPALAGRFFTTQLPGRKPYIESRRCLIKSSLRLGTRQEYPSSTLQSCAG